MLVELDQELAEFVVENCEVNMRMTMSVLQSIHDGGTAMSTHGVEKLVEMVEKFRRLRDAVVKARD